MHMTTTEKNWLQQFTTRARVLHADLLKIRKRDYDGWEPPDVVERRKMNEKLHEHDNLLSGLFKAMTASFGGLMRLDEKIKKK